MEPDKIRDLLPQGTQSLFNDIVTKKVLGASKHIDMIGAMFESIAKETANGDEIIDRITAVAEFFKATRGEASQAVSNAINIMIHGLVDKKGKPVDDIRAFVLESSKKYRDGAKSDSEKIVEYGVHLTKNMDTIMVFDYSSTVNAFLAGIKSGMTVYIPESRSINGGHAFVKTCLHAGHKVHFIPDAAMYYVLPKVQAVFIGAETFYPNGMVFNTTGSEMLAVLCKGMNIPYYVLTPMMKIDTRSIYGYVRPFVVNNLAHRLASNWEESEREKVDFHCPELLAVAPQYVTAYITEKGIIPTSGMFAVSMEYAKKLVGG